ncbi:hypothetical protein BN7_3470 [Wickerhamomyces ciferrii]|uniref:WW domain-containing protein n=1 Tax=Wickerhamomyces ciferrii (strain ATCC 14091 / BCRC 22168 / CBS 111 / JCM 3599 / NBRC 0793 / NRRL Y-1031 F-60-10) TaxID=1206466 RepID=K0KFK5_WICCF|nr:uncharacterized protein BN7_3470 [Wickerhamomyces ciferrii]CCH43915.1 hypothetical protein BN7_3470 [Wickerhamomyces ciferrii]
MTKLINKITKYGFSSEKQEPNNKGNKIEAHNNLNNDKKSLSINTTFSSTSNTNTRPIGSSSSSSLTSKSNKISPINHDTSGIKIKPIVKSSDWSIRYDPTLSVYFYVNDKTNETQFDHPDEVVSPVVSPILENADSVMNSSGNDTDHKNIFSTSLKRTFSPKLFTSSYNKFDERKPQKVPSRSSFEMSSTPKSSFRNSKDGGDDEDEDIEEFRKQLELEMKSYECERLRSL